MKMDSAMKGSKWPKLYRAWRIYNVEIENTNNNRILQDISWLMVKSS